MDTAAVSSGLFAIGNRRSWKGFCAAKRQYRNWIGGYARARGVTWRNAGNSAADSGNTGTAARSARKGGKAWPINLRSYWWMITLSCDLAFAEFLRMRRKLTSWPKPATEKLRLLSLLN